MLPGLSKVKYVGVAKNKRKTKVMIDANVQNKNINMSGTVEV